MEMLQKLRSTMSSAIPGNPLTRDYDMGKLVAVAGPGLYWKVYEAVKKTTKQESAVWVLEKRQLERYSKPDREALLEIFKKGVSSLTRIRHPHILQVHQPMEESRESIAFATEPVFACLANVILPATAMEGGPGSPNRGGDTSVGGQNVVLSHLQDYQLFETEKKYGFLQIGEGLAFLHGDCHQVHGNVCPQSIILVKNGSWKLACFDFTQVFNSGNMSTAAGSAKDSNWRMQLGSPMWQSNFPNTGQSLLDYLAPEAVRESVLSPAADMYSLGQLFYAVHNSGKPLMESRCEMSTYKRNVEELSRLRPSVWQCLPDNVREYVKLMLSVDSALRPDANQFVKLPYFDDPGVTALLNMDNVYQLDNLAKSQFYKALPKTVTALPKRINVHRIFPQLAEEFVNANMVPFVLPSVLHIIDMVTEREFVDNVLPLLLPVFRIQEPIQVTLICLQNLPILMAKMPPNDFKIHLLPMLNRALECDNPQIQELCFRILPSIGHLVEHTTLKNAVVPRLKRIMLSPGVVHMKVKCLLCLGQLMEHMDKWFVLDDILPLLSQVQSREPALLMAVLGIYRVAFSHAKLGITKEHLASRCLPFLLPLSIESNLNLSQFDEFMKLIKAMIGRLENEHRTKLEQLHGLEQEQRSLNLGADTGSVQSTPLPLMGKSQAGSTMMDEVMSGFGFSSSTDTSNPLKSSTSMSSNLGGFEFPAPSTLSTASTSANSAMSGAASRPLSLEDKQRLAQQQEQLSRMQQSTAGTGILQPSSTTPRLRAPPPKDLTSSLIDRNLMGLNTAPTSSTPMGQQQMWNGAAAMPSSASATFGAGVRPLTFGAAGGMPMMMGAPSSGMMMPIMNRPPTFPQPSSSLITNSPLSTTSAAKPLSSTDIDDLLG